MQWIDFRLPREGFSCPLALWTASHDRARRVVYLMQRLFAHMCTHGPSESTRVTSAEVRRYLAEAAPRHHADEDLDLFPRLQRRIECRGGDSAGADQALQAMRRLADVHGEIEALWTPLRAALEHTERQAPTAEHLASVNRYVERFVHHHGIEDQIILPVARGALEPADLAAIGESMAARRGTTWAALSGAPH